MSKTKQLEKKVSDKPYVYRDSKLKLENNNYIVLFNYANAF